ncbi:hypothetical protein ASPCADRAFT_516939 [Aspergillus carbonarius ITEM 5010]|uniref:Heterokaryon incompatibility domain-containing protein n=1 Tax=Aspergillus carbonarius (strain ITEM 5010) TaxID=602072 RepID=A0A1R3RHQ1_ASPC5|nr:hypothetical protein ASPCADRAFT_516939 [Aspergillus carbonarius ITEM 5010]
MQERLHHCLSHHDKCQKSIAGTPLDPIPALPTRTLDLGEGEDCHVIRLVESAGARGLYTALSYCWGPPDHWPLRTTNGNLQQHKSGIAVEALTKTYRDAITVTRSLGIRYLWIDALCIIQGDAGDWKNECERMGLYYAKAHLVIAASGAHNPTEGCFLPHPCFEEVILPFYSEGSVVGSFKIGLEPPPSCMQPPFTPLGDRAWATQEWWLARRIVHFVTGTLIWSCVSSDECRFGLLQIGRAMDMQMYSDWLWLVSDYSGRSLSRLTDRLAGIQGLANEFKKTRQDDYVMGIWTGELPMALLWKVCNDGWEFHRVDDLSVFPSWSWASVVCLVEECYYTIHDATKERFEPMAMISAILHGGMRLRITGCMTTGKITVSCREGVFEPETLRHRLDEPFYDISGHDEGHMGWAILDEPDDPGPDVPTHCVVIAKWITGDEEPQKPFFWCLLLEGAGLTERRADDIPTFRRIGVGVISEQAMAGTVETTVDLI